MYTYSKTLFVVYVSIKFNWVPCIFIYLPWQPYLGFIKLGSVMSPKVFRKQE